MGTSIEECDEAVPGVPVTGGSSTDLPRTETVAVSLCQRPRGHGRLAPREVAAGVSGGGWRRVRRRTALAASRARRIGRTAGRRRARALRRAPLDSSPIFPKR